MRRYLLDTSVLIGYLNGRPGATDLVTPGLNRREVGTSLLVFGEAVEYVRGRRDGTILYD